MYVGGGTRPDVKPMKIGLLGADCALDQGRDPQLEKAVEVAIEALKRRTRCPLTRSRLFPSTTRSCPAGQIERQRTP
jgi:hypothetical protein